MYDPLCINCGKRESEHLINKCPYGSTEFKRDDDYLDDNIVVDLPEGENA